MLVRFPIEILGMIAKELPKTDLKSLAQASKLLYEVAAKQLWHIVRIYPQGHKANNPTLDNFPPQVLKYISELQVASDFEIHRETQCAHKRDQAARLNVALGDRKEYERNTQRAVKFLVQIEEGGLYGFSWDMGSCVPPEIVGPNGLLSCKHPGIRSLKLSTDQTCNGNSVGGGGEQPDLSAFHQLQNLDWRHPTAQDVHVLAKVIKTNSGGLKKLELNFVDWSSLSKDLGLEDEELQAKLRYFWRHIANLNTLSCEPVFQSLQAITLSEVPLVPELSVMINWKTLRSLRLRHCPGWSNLLETVVRLQRPVQLRVFEIQTEDRHQDDLSYIADFLDSFGGLEEILLATPVFEMAFLLWVRIAQHQATLKRLVIHHRDFEEEDPMDGDERLDEPKMGLTELDYTALRDRKIGNPMHGLGLEWIGLSCAPEFLKPILETVHRRSSLKFLHIRQTNHDLVYNPCWAINGDNEVSVTNGLNDMMEVSQDLEEMEGLEFDSRLPSLDRLQDAFRSFAEWAFGPEGLTSLEHLAYGDFGTKNCDLGGGAWVNRIGRNNLFLSRNVDQAGNFELFHEEDACWEDLVEKYRDMLETCPAKLQATETA
ncbi:hypothetical protein BGZ63DRAFT_378097 [Mariannaea sp. PMI_226]|nr:hypothetical protein BGZ63DRAFT_378097 [Mariannaea sp. PMI_226]